MIPLTIDQAIHTADTLRPNQIERARKIAWLSQLDRKIFRDVVCTHQRTAGDGMPEAFDGYAQAADPDTPLLAPPPYDEMYRHYLEMQIDLVNLEYDKYNNSARLYAAAWQDFAAAWHRRHQPLETAGVKMRF